MTHRVSRRRFLKTAAGAVAAPYILPRSVRGANAKLNIAGIGVGGKGEVDVSQCGGENIVALCDPDEVRAAAMVKKFPNAKVYKDFRKMFDEMGKSIDAVTVSTPDHTHAVASVAAMKMGKHVYCQKPLTRTIHEARVMLEVAREKKVATQMGNQGHANAQSRRLVELIQGGVLGQVKEVHVWTDRPIWPQGIDRPKETPSVPKTLDWDLWLGPAPERPYSPAYVPFKWRGFWDFGTGAQGDMGCHNSDLAFWSLGLRDPVSADSEASGVSAESAPKWSIVTLQFPALGTRGPVKFVWYDGGKMPPADLAKQKELPKNGSILVGDKDTLYVPSMWGAGTFLSGAKAEDFKDIPEKLPRPKGDFEHHHHEEWIEACKGGAPAYSNFDYAAPMTEALLVGNLAVRMGKKIEWDAANLKAKNAPEADVLIRPEYRKGWTL
jgi:predicted dehydrogenase